MPASSGRVSHSVAWISALPRRSCASSKLLRVPEALVRAAAPPRGKSTCGRHAIAWASMLRSNDGMTRHDAVRAAVWGAVFALVLGLLIVIGSRNLAHFDAALVGYTFATLFAAFGIT